MSVAAAAGADIYYEIHGEGPAVVFIHGSGGHHASWWQQTPHFRSTYSVITLDLRGFGNTRAESVDVDSLAFPGDILAVLDEAQIGRAVLVGQSIGAAAALKLAVASPDRVAGVVLAHSLGGIDHDELKALAKADRAAADTLPVLDKLLSRAFQEAEPEKTFLFRQMGTFNASKMADLRNVGKGGPTLEQVKDSGVRVCFLAGENDAVMRPATVRRAHELLEGSTLELVPDGPHSMYWEEPARFNAAVERFLREVYGT